MKNRFKHIHKDNTRRDKDFSPGEDEQEAWQEKSNFGRRDDYTNESSYQKKKNKYYKEKPPHR